MDLEAGWEKALTVAARSAVAHPGGGLSDPNKVKQTSKAFCAFAKHSA